MLRHFAFLLLPIVFMGCASLHTNSAALHIKEIDWPIGEIRAVASSLLPAGVRAVSPNGHEILSKHFVLDSNGQQKPAGDSIERYFTHISILGDRRPYDIEILVTREKRALRGNQFTYVVTGYDMRLAKELERRLRTELTKRREDRNIIDDFRIF